ncbi:major strawberry allergen Fra a 1.05-like [Rutidosis leptorrhynchoides]|uniref:major strawberry allergen Fra a 1.05-like n=1 Tax=Rutidosis leptorrhynchoides TaxID=125765 RepID=UPI003A9A380B
MGVFTYENETTTPIAPTRMFNALAVETDKLSIKVAPHIIKSTEIIEGDGGVGTIKKITFQEGPKEGYMKHKIDSINKDNMTYNYSIIGGDFMTDKVEKISHENKIVASPDGGSILKVKTSIYIVDGADVSEDAMKGGQAKGAAMFKAIEAYLLANPNECN